jgi:hypothetical protein
MGIEQEKQQRVKMLRDLFPVAEDRMIKKTNAELNLNMFNLHWYFLRFAFSLLSYALYVPTLIELFQGAASTNEYIKAIIVTVILAILEIGLAYTLYEYYVRKHSENSVNNTAKYIAIGLCAASIILSGLGGVNAIAITDNSQEKIVDQTTNKKKTEMIDYTNIIASNNKTIKENQAAISENNKLIENLKGVALTKKGSAQIASLNARNKELQAQNTNLVSDNSNMMMEMKSIRESNDGLMMDRISQAGKKETTYMIIFFIAGIFAVVGLMFSYNYVARYYHDLKNDVADIEALDDFWKESQENDIRWKERRAMVTKQIQLRTLEIDKALEQAKLQQWQSRDEDIVTPFDEKKNHKTHPYHQLIH